MPEEITIIVTLIAIGVALVLGFGACFAVHTFNMRRRWSQPVYRMVKNEPTTVAIP